MKRSGLPFLFVAILFIFKKVSFASLSKIFFFKVLNVAEGVLKNFFFYEIKFLSEILCKLICSFAVFNSETMG